MHHTRRPRRIIDRPPRRRIDLDTRIRRLGIERRELSDVVSRISRIERRRIVCEFSAVGGHGYACSGRLCVRFLGEEDMGCMQEVVGQASLDQITHL